MPKASNSSCANNYPATTIHNSLVVWNSLIWNKFEKEGLVNKS